MIRPVLVVLALFVAFQAAAQQGSPVPEDTSQQPPASQTTPESPPAQQPPASTPTPAAPAPARTFSVDPTFCAETDQSFASNFEIYGLIVAGGLLCAIAPLLLPPLLGYRWWWLTQPTLRWVLLFIAGGLVVGVLWIGLPWFGRDSQQFRSVGLIAYPDVPARYYECIELSRSESGGFAGAKLFSGLLGSGTAPLVAQTGALLLAYFLTILGFLVLALAVRWLRMRWYGLPHRVNKGVKG